MPTNTDILLKEIRLSETENSFFRRKKNLTPKGIKPAQEELWEKVKKTKFVAIAWQAIFGDDFQVTESNSDFIKIKNQTEVLVNRFSLALFSCDNSTDAAELSGLLFRDKDINKNEKYLYRVYANIPEEIMSADTGIYFIDAGKITEYPKPIELYADFKDKTVSLHWNQIYYKGIYTAWSVERSEDNGKNFIRVNKNPIVNLHNERRIADHMYYIDSLPDNDKKYLYRIVGHTPFGDEGPPSDTVSGYGKEVLKAIPSLTKTLINNNNEVLINWEFPEKYNSKLKGFKISSALKAKGVYKYIHDDIISPEKRIYSDKHPKSTNYYKITAIDKYGREYKSQAYLVQLIDSTPPEPPAGLKGMIDSAGTVIISWNKAPEEDLFGYRVYMSNHLNSEFSQVTKKAIKDTVFRFKTTLNTLTKDMYLKITAEDNHFNPSEFSEIIKVTRPDTIAPSSPVIDYFRVTDTCIYLKWIRSTSKDVINHIEIILYFGLSTEKTNG